MSKLSEIQQKDSSGQLEDKEAIDKMIEELKRQNIRVEKYDDKSKE